MELAPGNGGQSSRGFTSLWKLRLPLQKPESAHLYTLVLLHSDFCVAQQDFPSLDSFSPATPWADASDLAAQHLSPDFPVTGHEFFSADSFSPETPWALASLHAAFASAPHDLASRSASPDAPCALSPQELILDHMQALPDCGWSDFSPAITVAVVTPAMISAARVNSDHFHPALPRQELHPPEMLQQLLFWVSTLFSCSFIVSSFPFVQGRLISFGSLICVPNSAVLSSA